MKRIFILIIACLGLVSFALAQENTLLWEVTKKNSNPSYLYGTIHLQDKRVFAFDDLVYKKIKACDALAVELVLDEIDFAELNKMMLMEEGTLSDYLSQEEYVLLDSLVKAKIGQPLMLFAKMKPFFLMAQLMQSETPKDMPLALDMHFVDTARDMSKTVLALEEMQDQIGAIDKISTQEQVDMLVEGIKDFDNYIEKQMKKLVEAYLKQDLQQIHDLMEDPSLPKEFGEELLVKRNHGMAKKLNKLMKKQTVFAAFGAGHLVGDEGVIALLRKKGYTVKPIVFKFSENN